MAQYKNIDIVPDETITRVHLSQGDIGRTLIFYLFENALSWSVPASSTIKCQGTKPSGFGFSVSCTYSGNTVTCVTTDEMTDEYGQIEAELVITSSDESQVFGTSNFILDIEKNPHPASTEDGNIETAIALTAQVTALTAAIGDLSDLETEAKTNLVSAINEANSHGGSGGGLTSDIKEALLDCFEHVAWIDANGQDYYDALESALYPPANLTSISAVYTQSGTVYDTDSLNDLKSDLVVTAHYDDSSTQTVSAYTLSGTLTTGTSTITVAYGGKTTTFTVTVTHMTVPKNLLTDYTWTSGKYLNSSGALTDNANYSAIEDYIPFSAGKTVTCTTTQNNLKMNIVCYNSNYEFISKQETEYMQTGQEYQLTAPENCAYIRSTLTTSNLTSGKITTSFVEG